MKAIDDFRDTTPSEVREFGFDYHKHFLADEILVSAEFALEVAETAAGASPDAAPASRLDGDATIETSRFSGENHAAAQFIAGCIDGNRYKVICRGTSNRGQTIELYAKVWCRVAV